MELILTAREDEAIKTFIDNDCDIVVKEIADQMCNSPRTLERHFRNARKRNGINTLSGLVFQYLKKNKELLASVLLAIQITSFITTSNTDVRKFRTKTIKQRVSKKMRNRWS